MPLAILARELPMFTAHRLIIDIFHPEEAACMQRAFTLVDFFLLSVICCLARHQQLLTLHKREETDTGFFISSLLTTNIHCLDFPLLGSKCAV